MGGTVGLHSRAAQQGYTVGLDKIRDAASQVSVMQEELEAIQPHLTAASQEVDKSVALVEKDLNEVSELEKIVKNEDAVVSDKTKQADIIRQDCQEELAEVATHLAFYAGWPAGMSAATVLKEVLDAR